MKRGALIGVLALALVPATAEAATRIEGDRAGRYQLWVDRAKVPTPDVTVTIHEGPCPDYLPQRLSCASRSGDVWLYSTGRAMFWHEMGHAFDFTTPTWRHERFTALLGLLGAPWKSPPRESGVTWRPGVEESFAETYGRCARFYQRGRGWRRRGTRLPRKGSVLPHDLSPRQFARVCRKIERVGTG